MKESKKKVIWWTVFGGGGDGSAFSEQLGPFGIGGIDECLGALLHIFRPVAHILLDVEDQILRTGHVMAATALAHVVHGAVSAILVVADVAVRLVALHLVLGVCRRGRGRG